MQNGYIERFNRLYREAVLDEYNHRRSHEGLQNMTQIERKNMLMTKEETKEIAV